MGAINNSVLIVTILVIALVCSQSSFCTNGCGNRFVAFATEQTHGYLRMKADAHIDPQQCKSTASPFSTPEQ
jgi:hypothetical protein